MGNRRLTIARILVHILALLPLAFLIWDFTAGNLTVNPIRDIQLRTGDWAIRLLMLSLACTPVYNVFALKRSPQTRIRALVTIVFETLDGTLAK